MSDEYTNVQPNKAFPGSLVDDTMTPQNAVGSSGNQQPQGGMVAGGSYGGVDPYDPHHQKSHTLKARTKSSAEEDTYDRPVHPNATSEVEFERNAGEGRIPPNEMEGAQTISSGVFGAQRDD
ncbi:hypothetical protein FRC04_004357 [Tulasnella sp. 424]|nr:hypothetical protein FRC04_004357 [Tulasnella sp. 424]